MSARATSRDSTELGRDLPFSTTVVIAVSAALTAVRKGVYAVAMSNGVASKTPSAIDGYARAGVPTPTRFHKSATRL
jgi:hypothetical protein